jgi:hypothetical protein
VTDFGSLDLRASAFKALFDRALDRVPKHPHDPPFLDEGGLSIHRLHNARLREEQGFGLCTADQASYLGECVLLLLDRLFHRVEETPDNHRLLIALALDTGLWIANRRGEIRELGLIVSGIATFANASRDARTLMNLHEASGRILEAADAFVKADTEKSDANRPWRLLCLNHCIIATRIGQPHLARMAYDRLIRHLPEEAPGFFRAGMQNLQSGHCPPQCADLVRAYFQMYCTDCPCGEPGGKLRLN